MAKSFAPRTSKRKRSKINLLDSLDEDLFKKSDSRLLAGARIEEIKLRDIVVKEQVRTKFNDSSIKELAENIKVNGLIQPLVVHREGDKYTLICGERRFRAMSSFQKVSAPCFILEGKTEEELMAIQFSENSSRENLHYIDKADGIYNYQKATKASERAIVNALGISKSEVHRSIIIGKLPEKMKKAAKLYDIEKYVLLEVDALNNGKQKRELMDMILTGSLTKRSQLRKLLGPVKKTLTKKRRTRSRKAKKEESALQLLKALKAKSSKGKLDEKAKKLLNQLLEENSI